MNAPAQSLIRFELHFPTFLYPLPTDYEDNGNQTLQKSSSATNASDNVAPTTQPSNVNNSSSKRKDGGKPDDSSKKEDTVRSQEEKRRHIKSIIDKIPTGKSDLFNYKLDWAEIDTPLMEKKIRPWINKKIIEYIGEPEPTLVDFICSKVMAGSTPQGILDDVQMVSICSPIRGSHSHSTILYCSFVFPLISTGVGRRGRSVCCENVAITHLRGRSEKGWPRQINTNANRAKKRRERKKETFISIIYKQSINMYEYV